MRCGAEVATFVLASVCQVVGTLFLVACVGTMISCGGDVWPFGDSGLGNGHTSLGAGDICERFCEDGSRDAVTRRGDCGKGLVCLTTRPQGWIGWDSCDEPDTCQQEQPQPACAGHDLSMACITNENLRQCHQLVADGCSAAQMTVMESCPLQFGCMETMPQYTPPGPPTGGPPIAAPSSASSGLKPPQEVTASPSQSASGGICDNSELWVAITKTTGVLGAILLVAATPLLSCREGSCAGPSENQQLSRAWGIYAVCGVLFLVSGILGIGYHVKIPLVVPVGGTLLFELAFLTMLRERRRAPTVPWAVATPVTATTGSLDSNPMLHRPLGTVHAVVVPVAQKRPTTPPRQATQPY
jgi:hypothetical protein